MHIDKQCDCTESLMRYINYSACNRHHSQHRKMLKKHHKCNQHRHYRQTDPSSQTCTVRILESSKDTKDTREDNNLVCFCCW